MDLKPHVEELYPGTGIQSVVFADPDPSAPPVPPLSPGSGGASAQNVLILYTGGTMGMRVNAEGALAPERGYLTEKILSMEELRTNSGMPRCHIKEYSPLIDSADMGHDEWCLVAQDIADNYYRFDGFVVICGTDTMSYASTALSFMLENLGKTVVFTGSQIPFCEVYNDARRNLIASLIFAANSDFSEVTLFFDRLLLRANRSKKGNAFGLDAFDSPNFPPLARLGVNVESRRDLGIRAPTGALRLHKQVRARASEASTSAWKNGERGEVLLRSTRGGMKEEERHCCEAPGEE